MSAKRVLALSGGGIRGYLQGLVINDLEKEAPFLDKVDLFCGTSTGAILAAYIASGQLISSSDLAEFYRKEGPKIFSKSLGQSISSVWGLYSSRYDPKPLKEALSYYLGDRRLGDLKKKVLIAAMDLGGDGRPYQAKFFDNFKSNSFDLDLKLVDVVMASTAAPTYFPAYKIDHPKLGPRHYVDGGLAANHPAMCGLAAALDVLGLSAKLEEVRMLQIATGYYPQSAKGWEKRGIVGWVDDVIDLTTEQYTTVYYQADKILGQRFFSVGTAYTENIKFDDPKAIAAIDRHYPSMRPTIEVAKSYLKREW